MKTIITVLLLTITASHAFAQVYEQTQDYYLAKSKYQKKAAWIILGSGTATAMLGVAITKANYAEYRHGNSSTSYGSGTALTVLGITAAFASIPVFIRAAHNKNEAILLSANLQNLQTLHTTGIVAIAQPSIKIRLNL